MKAGWTSSAGLIGIGAGKIGRGRWEMNGRGVLDRTSVDPSGWSCANLVNVPDDESGLVSMRARYYEPGTGRFISEDPARDGLNWFAYVSNAPLLNVDPTGRHETLGSLGTAGSLSSLIGGYALRGSAWISNQFGQRVLTIALAYIERANALVKGRIPDLIKEIEAHARARGCPMAELQWTSTTESGARFIQRTIEYLHQTRQGVDLNTNSAITKLYWLLETME